MARTLDDDAPVLKNGFLTDARSAQVFSLQTHTHTQRHFGIFGGKIHSRTRMHSTRDLLYLIQQNLNPNY